MIEASCSVSFKSWEEERGTEPLRIILSRMWKVKVRVGAAACSAQLSNTRAGVNRWLQVGHGECLHH